jgi:hypothetical protein
VADITLRLSTTPCHDDDAIPITMPIMSIVTRTSISVNPRWSGIQNSFLCRDTLMRMLSAHGRENFNLRERMDEFSTSRGLFGLVLVVLRIISSLMPEDLWF